tara:strand:- start:269 stop:799 length:531 start_codon:yes stop_codon:yes gene_type:complete
MLAVITVIGILCTILFQLAFYVIEQTDRSEAEVELESFRTMLDEYRISHRRYPQTKGLTDERKMIGRCVMALSGLVDPMGKPYPAGSKRASIIREGFRIQGNPDEYDVHQGGGTKYNIYILDPWESPYVYVCPAPDGVREYLLFSKGPDGRASSDSGGTAEDDLDNVPSNYPSGEF